MRSTRRIGYWGPLITAIALSAGCTVPEPRDGLATVVRVVDGDTIDVSFGGHEERVRLIGIDTPETKQPNAPIECFGPEASAFTTDLLPIGAAVRVERDIVGRDDYGRLLGYVHRVDDDLFVNLEIVAQGYAQPLTIEPNSTYAGDFASAASAAEREDIGMWAACAGTGR